MMADLDEEVAELFLMEEEVRFTDPLPYSTVLLLLHTLEIAHHIAPRHQNKRIRKAPPFFPPGTFG